MTPHTLTRNGWTVTIAGDPSDGYTCTITPRRRRDGGGGTATQDTPDAAIKEAIEASGWDIPVEAVRAIVAITVEAVKHQNMALSASFKAVSEEMARLKGAIERMAKRPGPKPPQHNLLVKPRVYGACARCGSQVPHPIYAFCTACRKATGKA
jgi:hypothetical protein